MICLIYMTTLQLFNAFLLGVLASPYHNNSMSYSHFVDRSRPKMTIFGSNHWPLEACKTPGILCEKHIKIFDRLKFFSKFDKKYESSVCSIKYCLRDTFSIFYVFKYVNFISSNISLKRVLKSSFALSFFHIIFYSN